MRRIAALYDIHANLPALEAVLSDFPLVDLVVVGGDVAWGPFPRETMDLLLSLESVEFIMGNADRDVFDRTAGRWKEVNDWCADQLKDEHLEFLRTRPAMISRDGVLFCHGSPRSDVDPITTRTPDERILEWCEGADEKVVVCGHTHAQFDRYVGDLRIVNAGSVGNPFGEPGAYWVMFDDDVDLRFTSYDVKEAAAAIRATGYPDAEAMAGQISNPGPAELAAQLFV